MAGGERENKNIGIEKFHEGRWRAMTERETGIS
jgi:hypothetical protein